MSDCNVLVMSDCNVLVMSDCNVLVMSNSGRPGDNWSDGSITRFLTDRSQVVSVVVRKYHHDKENLFVTGERLVTKS